ncbi:hypothetical protein MMC25_001643 [Agyrium rufum]|nr:hypothetical protein [Agyrium rufum]
MSSKSSPKPVEIDGTTLEGGGQLVRIALTLSALTGTPIHITSIRGNRAGKSNFKKSHQISKGSARPNSRRKDEGRGGAAAAGEAAGGLKSSHLAAVRWLAEATQADVEGAAIGSQELTFRPRNDLALGTMTMEDVPIATNPWREVGDRKGEVHRYESLIRLSTPGSVFLILQALLPYIFFSPPALSPPAVLHLIIHGGTNVSKSPSFEYVDQVLLPMLHHRLGLPEVKMTLIKRGWSTGRSDVGEVRFEIMPLAKGETLKAWKMKDRGEVKKWHVSILVSNRDMSTQVKERLEARLGNLAPGAEMRIVVDEDSRHLKRIYLLVVAETDDEYRLGRDWLYDRKITTDDSRKVADELVDKVVRDMKTELGTGSCADEYMADQLVVFQGLAEGKSLVQGSSSGSLTDALDQIREKVSTKSDEGIERGSLHTKTARWVLRKMTPIMPSVSGEEISGLGITAGKPGGYLAFREQLVP